MKLFYRVLESRILLYRYDNNKNYFLISLGNYKEMIEYIEKMNMPCTLLIFGK